MENIVMWNKPDNPPDNDRSVYVCGVHYLLGRSGYVSKYIDGKWRCEAYDIRVDAWHELPVLPGEKNGDNK
jgi:hypothetical protein